MRSSRYPQLRKAKEEKVEVAQQSAELNAGLVAKLDKPQKMN